MNITKKIKRITLGILGTAILASGLWACSNDDVSTNQINNEKQVSSKLNFISDEIYEIVDVLSITIDQKVNNPDLSDNELGEMFLREVKIRGVKVQDVEDLKSIHISEEFIIYANKIKYTNFDNYKDYIDYLYTLNNEIESNDLLTSEEKNILEIQIYFSSSFMEMLDIKSNQITLNEKKSIITYGNGRGWWDSWGECAAGVVGGYLTGGTAGCVGVGGLGAVVGGAAGMGIGSVPGSVVGGVGGCIVGGVAGAIGGALTGAATFC